MEYYPRIPLVLVLLAGWTVLESPSFVPTAAAQDTGVGNVPENGVFAQRRRRGNAGGSQAQAAEGGGDQAQPAGLGGRGGFGRGRGGRSRGGRGGRGGFFGGNDTTDPRQHAVQTIEQLDQNGDGMLQADEARFLRRLNADANNDDVITQDELTAGFANAASPGPPRPGGAVGRGGAVAEARGPTENSDASNSGDRGNRRGGRGGNRGNSENNSVPANRVPANRVPANSVPSNSEPAVAQTLPSLMTKLSYRLTPARDKLPSEGLPSWFASRDANRDGQISMSEYESNWDDRKVNAYFRIDLNRDGVITADEALKSN